MSKPVRPISRWKQRSSTPSSVTTKVDRWLQRLAHGAAPLALILAFLGYVFTVRPVFQYQRLQEQSARLEMEKAKSESDLVVLREKQAAVALEIHALEQRLAGEQLRSSRLASDAAQARAHEAQTRLRAAEVEASLAQQLGKLDEVKATTQREMERLDSARWELVLLDLSVAYALPEWNAAIPTHSSDNQGDEGAFIMEASRGWPQPYEALKTAVRDARQQNKRDIPISYFNELDKFVESHRAALQCDRINFQSMRDDYRREREVAETNVDTEAQAAIDKTIADYRSKGQVVRITDEYREAQRRSSRFGKLWVLGYVFERRLQDLRRKCVDKGQAVIEELKTSKGVSF